MAPRVAEEAGERAEAGVVAEEGAEDTIALLAMRATHTTPQGARGAEAGVDPQEAEARDTPTTTTGTTALAAGEHACCVSTWFV